MNTFLQTNPGLDSRFPIHIHIDFPDYTKDDLMQIAVDLCAKREYILADDAKTVLLRLLNPAESRSIHFGNARTVRNIIEKSIRRQAVRLLQKQNITRRDLMLLEACDLTEVTT